MLVCDLLYAILLDDSVKLIIDYMFFSLTPFFSLLFFSSFFLFFLFSFCFHTIEFRWELGRWSECFDIPCPDKYSIQKRVQYLIHAKFKDGKFVSEMGLNKKGIKRARLEHGDKIPEEPTSALEQPCRLARICEPIPPVPPPPVGCAVYKDKTTCCKKQCSWGDIDETGNKCYDKISSSMAYAMSATTNTGDTCDDSIIGTPSCAPSKIQCISGRNLPHVS